MRGRMMCGLLIVVAFLLLAADVSAQAPPRPLSQLTPIVKVNTKALNGTSEPEATEVILTESEMIIEIAKLKGSSTYSVRDGDVVYASVEGKIKKCTIGISGQCGNNEEIKYPLNTLHSFFTRGAIDLKVWVISPNDGERSKEFHKELPIKPYMAISTPVNGAVINPKLGYIGGSCEDCWDEYDPMTHNTKKQCSELFLLYCPLNASNDGDCLPENKIACKGGAWKIDLSSAPIVSHLALDKVWLVPRSGKNGANKVFYPGIIVGLDDKQPVITSPCLAGAPGCDATKNKTTNDEIHVVAKGDPGAKAEITLFDKDGKELDTTKCPKSFDATTGELTCDVPASTFKDKGPFVVHVKDTTNGKTAQTPPIDIFGTNKPVILSPCRVGAPGCDPRNNHTGGTPDKIHIDVAGPPGAGVKVTVTDKDGKVRTVKCQGDVDKCKYAVDGRFVTAVSPVDDNGEKMTGPFVIQAETTKDALGKQPSECKIDASKCTAVAGPIDLFHSDRPVIASPCRAGDAWCDVSENTKNGKLHVVVTGPPGADVDVKVIGSNGDIPSYCSTKFDKFGKWVCDVDPGNDKGPFVVKATTKGDVPELGLVSQHKACGGDVDQCTATAGPFYLSTEKPVILSPCRAGTLGCDPRNNHTGGTPDKIHVDATGVPGHKATVTITDKDGTPLDTSNCPRSFSPQGHLVCDVDPGTHEGPFVITVKDTDNNKETSTPPINIFHSDKPIIVSPCLKGTQGCPDGGVTNEADGSKEVKVVAYGPPNKKAKIEVTDKNGKTITPSSSTGTCDQYNAQGKLDCTLTIPSGSRYPITIKVKTLDAVGKPIPGAEDSATVNADGSASNQLNLGQLKEVLAGIVSGGCGCSSSNADANGLISLLLAALGLFVLRRRRED